MKEFREQLKKGSIQKAYRALLAYMMGLRTHFAKKHGDAAVSGLYQGYMDMTYFALFTSELKSRGLKVAIVLNYSTFRVEAWLSGRNRNIQKEYYELLKTRPLDNYRLVAPAEGIDSIVECDLTMDLDLSVPEALTSRIESGAAELIEIVEKCLREHQKG